MGKAGSNALGSCEKAARACLDRIERYDPLLKALITVCGDAALARALELDAATDAGRWGGVLHGMPIILKDNIDTEAIRTTCGSRFFADHVPSHDAEVVRRLNAAGAVIIGKANLHEFAYGGTTQNPFYGRCRNVWDPERIPGGSSGGSAVSVAADMSVASLGTDTGGSGRLPAALNGIAALRPTYGRISNRGVMPVSPPFDTISPMARRVVDIARVYSAISGYDPGDPITEDRPVEDVLPHLSDGITGVRIGMPRAYFFEETDADILDSVMAAARRLEQLGARLVSIDIDGPADAKEAFEKIFHTDCADIHRERLARSPELFGNDTRERLGIGSGRPGIDYAAGLRWMEGWCRQIKRVFDQVDIVLSPMVPVAPPLIAESDQTTAVTRRLTRFCYVWSIARVPVLALPCGFSLAGLPVALSLAAAWFNESVLFRVGCAYQAVTDWHLRKAPLLTAAADT